ncbi:hypothetical protein TWF696_008613 [Orbilia brochopaga]|uniref:Uncharacterized protein n=1 Tax=Orbilia brochopaga TaxID=3140254 RepID=A0AAV9UHL7_9PEZI
MSHETLVIPGFGLDEGQTVPNDLPPLALNPTRPKENTLLDSPVVSQQRRSGANDTVQDQPSSTNGNSATEGTAAAPTGKPFKIEGRNFSLRHGRELLSLGDAQWPLVLKFMGEFYDRNPDLDMETAGILRGNKAVVTKICTSVSDALNSVDALGDPAMHAVVQNLKQAADRDLINWVLYSIAIEVRRSRRDNRKRKERARAAKQHKAAVIEQRKKAQEELEAQCAADEARYQEHAAMFRAEAAAEDEEERVEIAAEPELVPSAVEEARQVGHAVYDQLDAASFAQIEEWYWSQINMNRTE